MTTSSKIISPAAINATKDAHFSISNALQVLTNRPMRLVSVCSLLFLCLLNGCKNSNEKRYTFSNPLDDCKNTTEVNGILTYDRLNNLTFKAGSQWKITFNDSQNVTGGIDTVASDKFSQIRTFTINTTPSKKSIRDFFVEEVTLMERDSSVTILSLGERLIDDQIALYVIAKMTAQFSVNTVFFYTKHQESIIVIQLSINANEPIGNFCELMYIINSVSLKPESKPSVALLYL